MTFIIDHLYVLVLVPPLAFAAWIFFGKHPAEGSGRLIGSSRLIEPYSPEDEKENQQ